MSKNNCDGQSWPRGFDEHRREQIIRLAQSTTPAQRLAWVEEMLEILAKTGKPYHQRKREALG